jgi:site-specific recombinase XerD
VVTTELGKPVEPRNILRTMELASARAGVPAVVHSLRHAAASALLDGGVSIKVVADLLGHSSVAITGDIDTHTTDAASTDAVAGLSDVFGV